MISELQKASGQVRLTLKDKNGNVLRDDVYKNTITTAGKNALAAYVVNTSPTAPFMSYLQAGTNGTTLAASALAGATSISVNNDILSGSTGSIVINVGPTPSNPNTTTETVAVSAKSGTGPYTYTVSTLAHAHNAGEDVVQETTIADTALFTASGSAISATLSSSTNTWSLAGTFTAASNTTLYEFGIFNASGGSGSATMYSHITTSAYTISSSSTLDLTWTITFS